MAKKKSAGDKRAEAMRTESAERHKERKAEEERLAKIPKLKGKFVALRTFGTPQVCYKAGDQYTIGIDMTEEQAKSWLKSGYIERISDLPKPKEVK
jgi:hypothetical protein